MNARQRSDFLLRRPDEGLGRTLAAAVRHAAGDELSFLCHAAVRSARSEACSAVVRRLHRLPEHEQEPLFLRSSVDWRPALQHLATEADERIQRNVLAAIRHLARPPYATLIPLLLDRRRSASTAEDGSPRSALRFGGVDSYRPLDSLADEPGESIENLAESTFLAIVEHSVGSDGLADCVPVDRQALEETLRALATLRGDRPSRDLAMAAALLSARPSEALEGWLGDAQSPLNSAMRRLARDPVEAGIRRNILRWLNHPLIGAAIARSIHLHVEAGGFEAVLERDGHLLRSPRRAAALQQVVRPARAVPPVDHWSAFSWMAQRHLVRWVLRLPLSTASRTRLLSECTRLDEPTARAEAATALAGLRGQACADVLLPMIEDPAPFVARTVLAALRSERIPAPVPSAHAVRAMRFTSLRQRTLRRRASYSPEAFLEHIDELPRPDRSVIGRSLLKSGRSREALLAQLGDAMLDPKVDSRKRLAVLDLIRRLDLARCFAEELLVLCASSDRRIAATALRASSRLSGSEHVRIVRAALLSGDDRLRANAVEAMAGVDERDWKDRARVLELLMQDADSRTRANAVRALLVEKSPRAGVALREMLCDPRPRHRISALWAAGSARAAHAASVVRQIADDDPIPLVRTRAAGVLAAISSPPVRGAAAPPSPTKSAETASP